MAEQANPLKSLFKDIANAIREKDGTAELIPHASDFPSRIRAIPSGGKPPDEERLPTGYIELQYLHIEYGNVQFVDGVTINSAKHRMVYRCRSTVGYAYSTFFTSACQISGTYYFYGSYWSNGYHVESGLDDGGTVIGNIYDIDTVLDLDPAKKTIKVNDDVFDLTVTEFTNSPLYFGYFPQNTRSTAFTQDFYGAALYEGDTKIREWIPAKNPNGELGLFELVNKNFIPNTGTDRTKVTAGPEI